MAKDWDKELAKVDKAMAREGGAQLPPQSRPLPATTGATPAVSRRSPFYTWLRLTLALGLGIGMTQWPYLHGCGFSLFAYLGGVATVIIASCWSMISSWRSRSVVAHFLSIALLLWGSALGARELLPRIGYARQSANWLCAQPGQPNPAAPLP